ncbi:unnamed protein product [Owenia fusiformis]|uniref:Uncharacterized protein n=1 Tax=Owenia fusiformis TaxID=6347 RepID=A0A8J1TT14_OWEFU|nr:unnamed protein product [Owenia fusiformis]
MLNSIASYLFGQNEEVPEGEVELTVTPTEASDWVLVDKSGEVMTCNDAELPGNVYEGDDFKTPVSFIPHHQTVTPPSLYQSSNKSTPSSSSRSTPTIPDHVGPNESWFMTPPPCFIKGGRSPHAIVANPLEDLLIEHPSMSVYGKHRSDSRGSESDQSVSSTGETSDIEDTQPVLRRSPRRPAPVVDRAGLLVKYTKSMQRSQQKQTSKRLSPNMLERTNKIRQHKFLGKTNRQHMTRKQPAARSCQNRC